MTNTLAIVINKWHFSWRHKQLINTLANVINWQNTLANVINWQNTLANVINWQNTLANVINWQNTLANVIALVVFVAFAYSL